MLGSFDCCKSLSLRWTSRLQVNLGAVQSGETFLGSGRGPRSAKQQKWSTQIVKLESIESQLLILLDHTIHLLSS